MQETQVQSLIQEDPTCHGVTKPVCHSFFFFFSGTQHAWHTCANPLLEQQPKYRMAYIFVPAIAATEPVLHSPGTATAEPKCHTTEACMH